MEASVRARSAMRKKGRPGCRITVIARPAEEPAADISFGESAGAAPVPAEPAVLGLCFSQVVLRGEGKLYDVVARFDLSRLQSDLPELRPVEGRFVNRGSQETAKTLFTYMRNFFGGCLAGAQHGKNQAYDMR
mgnify:CR=1 FL=1